MPYDTYRCTACDTVFETLVRSSDDAPAAKTPGMLGKVRAQAAREGHFSNYSRSDLKRK